jgi:EmrB/QacA subfamily drug resistance transporter
MISSVVNSLMNSSLNIALPTIGREFSMNAVGLSWVAQSMLLASSILVVPFGRLADIHGRKRLMTIGSIVYVVSSFSSAIAVNAVFLILSRVLQGIGAAMIFSTSVALLTSVFPPERKGWAIGWNVSAVYFGLAAGPFIGGMMTHAFGWRSLFWLNAGLGLVSVLFLTTMLKGEWADAKGETLDITGSLILAATIVCFVYGLSKVPALAGFILVAAGAALFFVFVKVEEKKTNAVVNVKLFEENRMFTFSNLATLFNYSAAFSVGFLLSLYLQFVKGFDVRISGTILMAQPLVMVLLSPIAGRLSDRIEPGKVASLGMALTVAGLLMLAFLGESTGLPYIIASLVVIGAGYALFSSPNTNAVMSSIEKRYYGIASGIVSIMRQMGMMVGLAIGTMMLSIFVGKIKITPDHHQSFLLALRWAFGISTLLCIAGVFASLARRTGKETRSGS